MNNIEYTIDAGELIIKLSGHIDSNNAPEVEQKLLELCDANMQCSIVLDFEKLEYISSAGLRVVLKLKKRNSNTKIINASQNVYEILEMTGFTQMLDVRKAFKTISVEGCEVIGKGANGLVSRIDDETIVKTFMDENALIDIERERQLARTAFVLGVPTAISYDVVKIEGGGYGSVYELLKATNFAKVLANGEKSLDEVVEISVDLLKTIHSKEVEPTSMPSMRERGIQWADFLKGYIPSDQFLKLTRLMDNIPEDYHMLHGDFHLKNIMLQDGEALLIDMDTICHGHPIFEFASIYNAYCGFSDVNHNQVLEFLGIPYDQSIEIWRKTLNLYFKGRSQGFIDAVQSKAMIIGYTRILRREIRRDGLNNEKGMKVIENAKKHLAELLPAVDSLVF